MTVILGMSSCPKRKLSFEAGINVKAYGKWLSLSQNQSKVKRNKENPKTLILCDSLCSCLSVFTCYDHAYLCSFMFTYASIGWL